MISKGRAMVLTNGSAMLPSIQRKKPRFACVGAVIRAGHRRVAAETLTDYATSRASSRHIMFTFTY
jgi:hypothetical protein